MTWEEACKVLRKDHPIKLSTWENVHLIRKEDNRIGIVRYQRSYYEGTFQKWEDWEHRIEDESRTDWIELS
jgi:hypothetical protein